MKLFAKLTLNFKKIPSVYYHSYYLKTQLGGHRFYYQLSMDLVYQTYLPKDSKHLV